MKYLPAPPHVAQIIAITAAQHGVSAADVAAGSSPRRRRMGGPAVTAARRAAVHELRKAHNGYRPSTSQIGRWLNLHHSTIVYYLATETKGDPMQNEDLHARFTRTTAVLDALTADIKALAADAGAFADRTIHLDAISLYDRLSAARHAAAKLTAAHAPADQPPPAAPSEAPSTGQPL